MTELMEPVRFEWAFHPDDVWNTSPFHVEGLHQEVIDDILAGVEAARRSDGSSPMGVAIQGQRGVGKTHMLGWIRNRVQAGGGYFFLISLLDSATFWESTMLSVLDGLLRESDGKESQLKIFLRRLSTQVGLSGAIQGAIAGDLNLAPDDLSTFVSGLRRSHRAVGIACQDTLRALVLYASADLRLQDIGYSYLQSMEEGESADRAVWGLPCTAKSAQQILKELSHLLALTGPTVIAVDQMDTLVAQTLSTTVDPEIQIEASKKLLFDQIAHGLMGLREITRRTLAVVTCLSTTWELIRTHSVDTLPDRFRNALQLETIPTAVFGRALIEKRLAAQYREIGFKPPYPTWPVLPSAFEEATSFTPRGLMKAVGEHIDGCLRRGRMEELTHLVFREGADPSWNPPRPSTASPPPDVVLDALDRRFEGIRRVVDVESAFDDAKEDTVVPQLLSAGLEAFIEESRNLGRVLFQDPPPGRKALLHARLREDIDEETENETHWAFRAISSMAPVAALNRIRAACTSVGLHKGIPGRKLYLLRNAPWSKGPKTQEALAELERAGGVCLRLEEDDLRTFAALKDMLSERDPNLKGWLADRKPATSTKLFQTVFGELLDTIMVHTPVANPVNHGSTDLTDLNPTISVGSDSETGRPVVIGLESLRKHTAIFAGSGSGKTVLIRRLVEECALHGVSAIVLDPNNDLARLGDSWPDSPENWGEGDSEKARAYIADTDVVVWTPGREGGRPVSLKPLPDFASVLDDRDEFNAALNSAVTTLAPRAKVAGELSKAVQSRAVLREALQYFAKQRATGLRHFISILAELPSGISALSKADKLAAEMADTLAAAMVNDPLFGGEGETLDPGALLTPRPGRRARVSVISFVGLPSDDQRQSFVNQLQMALFAWIKKNPAGDRPLGGLLVMDEAQTLAPSGAMTACTQSTLALASQARKYGLGLVFATQAPKGLHNRIAGNAATQIFGFLNSPVQIAAAREMAQAKGGEVLDISRLKSGQFYLSGDGTAFQRIEARMCLSHHPRSPLTTEEVLERARRDDV